jgi:Tfp pilus assembly protein FimT
VLCVAGLIVILSGIAVPTVLGSIDRSRGYAAARYLGTRLNLARTQAVARSASVALRFEEDARGISFTVYQDGNRNGVRTRDIQRGVDPMIDPPARLFELFPGVEIAVTPEAGGGDGVQVGSSNLLSFSPMGTATSGTVYVKGSDGTQWAVRVLGATGRTRVLRFDTRTGQWVNPL